MIPNILKTKHFANPALAVLAAVLYFATPSAAVGQVNLTNNASPVTFSSTSLSNRTYTLPQEISGGNGSYLIKSGVACTSQNGGPIVVRDNRIVWEVSATAAVTFGGDCVFQVQDTDGTASANITLYRYLAPPPTFPNLNQAETRRLNNGFTFRVGVSTTAYTLPPVTGGAGTITYRLLIGANRNPPQRSGVALWDSLPIVGSDAATDGLELNEITNILSGTPTRAVAEVGLAWAYRDANGSPSGATSRGAYSDGSYGVYTSKIRILAALSVSGVSTLELGVNEVVDTTFTVTGVAGTPGVTSSPSLPTGLVVTLVGGTALHLHGTVTFVSAAADYTLSVTDDTDSASASHTVRITVSSPPVEFDGTIGALTFTIGQNNSYNLPGITSGTAPFTHTLTTGADWLVLTPPNPPRVPLAKLSLTGAATYSAQSTGNVYKVESAGAQVGELTFSADLVAAPNFASTQPALTFSETTTVNQTLIAAQDGAGDLKITAFGLPGGLALASTANPPVIAGVPNTPTPSPIEVIITATDANFVTANLLLTMSVHPAPSFSPASIETLGNGYTFRQGTQSAKTLPQAEQHPLEPLAYRLTLGKNNTNSNFTTFENAAVGSTPTISGLIFDPLQRIMSGSAVHAAQEDRDFTLHARDANGAEAQADTKIAVLPEITIPQGDVTIIFRQAEIPTVTFAEADNIIGAVEYELTQLFDGTSHSNNTLFNNGLALNGDATQINGNTENDRNVLVEAQAQSFVLTATDDFDGATGAVTFTIQVVEAPYFGGPGAENRRGVSYKDALTFTVGQVANDALTMPVADPSTILLSDTVADIDYSITSGLPAWLTSRPVEGSRSSQFGVSVSPSDGTGPDDIGTPNPLPSLPATATLTYHGYDSSGQASVPIVITAVLVARPSFSGNMEEDVRYLVGEGTPFALPSDGMFMMRENSFQLAEVQITGLLPITYSLFGLPSDLTFDPSDRSISGTPTESSLGVHEIVYTATDANNVKPESPLTFSITVLPQPEIAFEPSTIYVTNFPHRQNFALGVTVNNAPMNASYEVTADAAIVGSVNQGGTDFVQKNSAVGITYGEPTFVGSTTYATATHGITFTTTPIGDDEHIGPMIVATYTVHELDDDGNFTGIKSSVLLTFIYVEAAMFAEDGYDLTLPVIDYRNGDIIDMVPQVVMDEREDRFHITQIPASERRVVSYTLKSQTSAQIDSDTGEYSADASIRNLPPGFHGDDSDPATKCNVDNANCDGNRIQFVTTFNIQGDPALIPLPHTLDEEIYTQTGLTPTDQLEIISEKQVELNDGKKNEVNYVFELTATDFNDVPMSTEIRLLFILTAGDAYVDVNTKLLGELSNAIVSDSINAVTGRIAQRVSAGNRGQDSINASVGGYDSLAKFFAHNAKSMADGDTDWKQLFDGTQMQMPLTAADGSLFPGGTAFWMSGRYREYQGDSPELQYDGQSRGVYVGLDSTLSDTTIIGLMGAWARSEIDYDDIGEDTSAGKGNYLLDLSGVHPYISWRGGGLDWWASIGHMRGDLTISRRDAQDRELEYISDAALNSTALGFSGTSAADRQTQVRVKAEVFSSQLTLDETQTEFGQKLDAQTIDGGLARLAMEVSSARLLASGGLYEPTYELGLRYDFGDSDTGGGIDASTGFRAAGAQREVSGELRLHAALSADGEYEEWGVFAMLRNDPGLDGQGLSLQLRPSYGDNDRQDLWSNSLDYESDPQEYTMQIAARVGWGIQAARGIFTPFTEWSHQETNDTYRLGVDWALRRQFTLNLTGQQKHSQADDESQSVLLRGQMDF